MSKNKVDFWQKVEITSNQNGCWLWKGTKSRHGYGRYYKNDVEIMAHRFSYQEIKGPVANGLHIDHLCRNTSCVNPDHLEAVSIATNVLRGIGISATNHRKTHCIRGHIFDAQNTGKAGRSGSGRRCKKCELAYRQINKQSIQQYMKNYYLRKKEKKDGTKTAA